MSNIIDFNEKKKENINAKTRQFERIFFTEIIGCYSEIDDGEKIFQVEIVDISETGCLIEVPKSSGALPYFEIDSEQTLRLYFTKKSFITLHTTIVRGAEGYNEEKVGVYQFGTKFNTESKEYDTFKTFISFIKKFAQHSHVDNSSKKVYFF